MELAELRKLVRLMQSAELTELEIDDAKAGVRVHLKRRSESAEKPGLVPPLVQVMPTSGPGMPMAVQQPSAPAPAPGGEPGWPAGTEPFPSPMVGTFYRASAPDSDPFVEVGTRVTEESVLCIIEAMKVMNEIKAERRGEIVEILVENGEPVEFGQPLFLLRKG